MPCRLYFAGSSADRAQHFTLMHEWLLDDWVITSNWPLLHPISTPDQESRIWTDIVEAIKSSDVLAVVPFTKAAHRGSLVEVGMALAFGKEVYLVGNHLSYSHFRYHPQVIQVTDLGALKQQLA